MNNNRTLVMNVLSQQAFLSVNKTLIQQLGLTESVVLSALIEIDRKYPNRQDDWFFVTAENLQSILNLKRWAFDSSIRKLTDRNIIEKQSKGCPPKTHYRINYSRFLYLLSDDEFGKNIPDSFVPNNSICMKPTDNLYETNNQNVGNLQNHINKKENKKENNTPTPPKGADTPDEEFERWYNLYDKKAERQAAWRMWQRLTAKQKQEIIERTPAYVASTPDKKYRMNPATYINPANCRWQDEIVTNSNNSTNENHVYNF